MRMVRTLTLAVCAGFSAVASAAAQDQGSVGITMGYPAAVGVLWRATETVAVRPEISFSGGQSETSASTLSSESESSAVGVGVSVLFYVKKENSLRTYFSPRFTYSHSTSTVTSSSFQASGSKNTGKSTGGSGSFGAEYQLGDKFAVFGEVGLGFSRTTSTGSTDLSLKLTSSSWGTRAGVGVIFFP